MTTRVIQILNNLMAEVEVSYSGTSFTIIRKMDNAEIKEAMGVKSTAHWPDEGIGPQLVGNVAVRVSPKKPRGQGRRCEAQCNRCLGWFCAGHLDQHRAACEKSSS